MSGEHDSLPPHHLLAKSSSPSPHHHQTAPPRTMRTSFVAAFLLILADSDGFVPFTRVHPTIVSAAKHRPLRYAKEVDDTTTPPGILSPVLKKIFPDLQDYVSQYGHPNIPLGSSAGRGCATLRRLRIQGKLTESEVALLDSLGFTWHSLEDVYEKEKERFDDLFGRLVEYGGDLSPPKKYKEDPELGAWVTALRRLHRVGDVDRAHVQRLDTIGFQWISPRQCGSKFMIQYREIVERLKTESKESVLIEDPRVTSWIKAQQNQFDGLSETRKQYIGELLGSENWREWSPE